jgi:hypothetical protein
MSNLKSVMLEKEIHNKYKKQRYIPSEKFGG